MKKQNLLLIVLSILLLSWKAYSQVDCVGSTQDGCNPTLQYDVDESGNLLIATANIEDGVFRARIFFRSEGGELTFVKEVNSSLQGIKIADGKILYTLNNSTTVNVKMLQKNSSGNYVESNLFPELLFNFDEFSTYKYDNLAFEDGFAYVRKTKTKWSFCYEFGSCFAPISNDITYIKANIDTGVVQEVESIPGNPSSESRYFFSFSGSDIYRQDTLTGGPLVLWLANAYEGGVLGNAFVSGDFMYISYNTPDGSTSLVAAKITDDIAEPKKILIASLMGWIYLVDYPVNELKIQIAQTNLLDPLPVGVTGPTIAPKKEVVAFIKGAKTGNEVKVYIKGAELEPSLISTKVIQSSDMDADGKAIVRFSIPLTVLDGTYKIDGTHEVYIKIGDKKSNEYTVVVDSVPNLRVLLVKVKSPYPLCVVNTPKGQATNCYITASDILYNHVVTRQIPFTNGVFPYKSNSSDITFVPVEIEGNLPSPPLISSFVKDYETVISKMTEQTCQRAVLVVDHSYVDFNDNHPFLNPAHIQKAGTSIGRFAFVMEEYSQVLAHELAHTFGVGHSSDANLFALDGYSKANLKGIDTRFDQIFVSESAQDFMWGRPHEDDFFENPSLNFYWTHRLTYNELTSSIRRNILGAGSAQQDLISVTGFLTNNNLVTSASTKIVNSSLKDPNQESSPYSISTVDANGNILNTIKFTVNFEEESLVSDPHATFVPTVQRASVPFTVFITYNESVKKVLIKKNGIVLKELPPSTYLLSLQEGLSRIPDIGFIKDQSKSRQELAKFIQKIEDGKAKNNYNQVIAHLEVLRKQSDQLLKIQYPVTPEQISKTKFDEIIARELELARERL